METYMIKCLNIGRALLNPEHLFVQLIDTLIYLNVKRKSGLIML